MMKNFVRAALAAGLCTILLVSAAPMANAAQGYPMTCMVGPANSISIGIFGVMFEFTKSTGPAAAGLVPGQCAFEDRAVRSNEPTTVCAKTKTEFPFGAMSGQNGKMTLASDGTDAGNLIVTAFQGPTKLYNFTVDNPKSFFGHICFEILNYGV